MQIIAADLGIALPIAMAAFSVIIGSVYATQAYLLSYSRAAYVQIRDYAASQQILQPVWWLGYQGLNATYVQNMGRYYNVSVDLAGLGNSSACEDAYCRVVEIGGISRLLVVR